MSANLLFSADHTDSLRVIDGDVVALIETRYEDRERMRNDPRWPYQRWIGPPDWGGTALLSRWPMRAKELDMLDAPGVDAVIDMPWGPVRVIAVHTWSPRNRISIGRNMRQLRELAGLAATEPGPLLVLGDLNASPGHPGIVGLRQAGLRQAHGGSPATWPSWLGPFGITIDHALVRGLRLGGTQAIDLPGSDHHGIRLQLSSE
jgi:endonuclease/exonuclease/phosphatase family metal-dependent hydrolase